VTICIIEAFESGGYEALAIRKATIIERIRAVKS
jgi:hypothetical protein